MRSGKIAWAKGEIACMKEIRTIYRCNRCGKEIDSFLFEFGQGTFKSTMSATEYEQVKYGYLPDDIVPLPNADVIVLDGICGYRSKGIKNIHFCRKCTKDFKKFMKMAD